MTLKLMKVDGIGIQRVSRCTTLHADWMTSIWSTGITRETIDGEQFTTIEDMDSLWKVDCP